jgi:hypothetical protein
MDRRERADARRARQDSARSTLNRATRTGPDAGATLTLRKGRRPVVGHDAVD